jgi:hypothetical protein
VVLGGGREQDGGEYSANTANRYTHPWVTGYTLDTGAVASS